jgi:hypothetical protein
VGHGISPAQSLELIDFAILIGCHRGRRRISGEERMLFVRGRFARGRRVTGKMIVVVEVEVVDEAQAEDVGVEGVRGGDRGTPKLELVVGLERDARGEGDVESATGGVDVRGGGEIGKSADGVAVVLIVNLTAAGEEVYVDSGAVDGVVDADSAEDILLSGDVTRIDGVGAAGFEARKESVEGAKAEVEASRYTEVFSAFKASEGSGSSAECREMEAFGGGRSCLSVGCRN